MARPHMAIYSLVALLLSPAFQCANPFSAEAQTKPSVESEDRKHAIELYGQRKFADASKLLRKVVKENKSDEEGWYYLGLSLVHQDKGTKDASKAFEAALKLRPNFAAARAGLSYSLLLRNKPNDAIHEAQAALAIDPSIVEAHYIIGVVRMNSGNAEDALTEAKEANRLNPQFPAAYLLRSRALLVVYAKKSARNISRPTPPSPEQRVERRKERAESAAVFKEAAESLETYLGLNPVDSSTGIWREQLATLKIFASYGAEKPNIAEPISYGDDVTTKVRVLEKPEPVYTEPARQSGVTGTVVLRAVFAADGTIRHILVLNGLPNGLTEQALNAARRIKFVPATIDGRPVSIFIQLEYGFNLY
ncbi:MAG: TonB family protein [Pyrinomonadaceae bacterium]